MRDEIISGLQRDRSQVDQVYSCWLELTPIHGQVLHMLEMCCFPFVPVGVL